ncbi:MAG: hypothetical protein AAF410_05880 [Pseudomonadota bacterium]
MLLPENTNGDEVLTLMYNISSMYYYYHWKNIDPILNIDVDITGVNFGVDKGTLISTFMHNKREYIGRALNVAARLQGSISQNDNAPQYKVLMTNSVYNDFDTNAKNIIKNEYVVEDVRRTLKNVQAEKDFRCKKIILDKE